MKFIFGDGMAKYDKYILLEPIEKDQWAPSIHVCGHKECYGAALPEFPVDLRFRFIKEPFVMLDKPHTHEVDELLFVLGSNLANFFDFDAEIEIYLGEEQEKHLIDTTAIIYVPKGLAHGPLIIKRVGKPFLWGHILFAPTYYRQTKEHEIEMRPHSGPYTDAEKRLLRGR
ncbi:MAG: hypothetical protein ABIM44_04190 [candidate division WOR-3 bacterium]